MYILENTPLSTLSTMRLGGNARYMTDVNDRKDVQEAYRWAKEQNLPVIMIGEGSNIIWTDGGFNGLVLVNKILGFDIYEEDEENIYVTVGAGEHWDDVVERVVERGFSGIEQLSLVPGTAGATPVQNVGAYGREIADVLTTVEAFDTKEEKFVTIMASDCEFGYRTSRFKTSDKNRYLITAITIRVNKLLPKPPFYSAIEKYFEENSISVYSPALIRKAVIAIRMSKLPDPTKVANVGSFFHNPVVESSKASLLSNQYENLPHWPIDNNHAKLSAAWLIEQAGFKDFHHKETGMSTWPTQPLVFVNEKAVSTADLLKFKMLVVEKVKKKFDVDLVQEPELIGE